MTRRTTVLSVVAFLFGSAVALLVSLRATSLGDPLSPASSPVADAGDAADPSASDASTPPDVQTRLSASRQTAIVRAVQQLGPSVAAVEVEWTETVTPFGTVRDPGRRAYLERLLPFRSYRRFKRFPAGTALAISDAGELITNYHVIAGAERVFITDSTGQSTEAEIVGFSPNLDLALLRADLPGLAPAEVGDSRDLFPGEWVVAVGFPVLTRQSAQHSVTVGVVSATRRTFQPTLTNSRDPGTTIVYTDMIQTDAAINPGNSGGPLADAEGKVVGLNTFMLTESGGSDGLGFAIPIERAMRAAAEFRNFGRVRDIEVGFRARPVDRGVALEQGLSDVVGLHVYEVTPGGTAEAGGLVPGDIILEIERLAVSSRDDAVSALLPHFAGEDVLLTIWRNGQMFEMSLRLVAVEQRADDQPL